MDQLTQDLKQAFRMLRTAPALSILAIVTLAVGIGANAAIASAVSALLLRPLPIPDIDRVVFGVSLREGVDPFGTSPLDFARFRDEIPAFSAAGIAARRTVNLTGNGDPEGVAGSDVTASYFDVLQVSPALGRAFRADDDRAGAAVAIIGHDLWRRRFAARRDVLGATISTDAGPLTVVGVMPRGFDQPGGTEFWIAGRLDVSNMPFERAARHDVQMIARLRPEATHDGVNAALRAAAARLELEYPVQRRGWSYSSVPLRQELLGDLDGRTARNFTMLGAAVALLLLICCANVAALLLVRGVGRAREIMIRLALGASRPQIVRQLAVESAVLGAFGGVAGLILASWLLPMIAALNPVRATSLAGFLNDFRIDWRVLLFTAAVSVLSAAIFAVAPVARHALVRDIAEALRRRDVRSGGDRWSRRVLGAIVTMEIAVAATLLVAATFVARSFDRLLDIDHGFRPERVQTLQLALSRTTYPTHAERTAAVDRLIAGLRALPGVEAAGASTNLPLDEVSQDAIFTVEGRPPRSPSEVPITAHRIVTAGYLEALGVRLVRGRLIGDQDRAGQPRVVVVTEEFVRQAWPGNTDPIGRRVRRGGPNAATPWLTVVGVIGDTKEDLFNYRMERPAWYMPYAQEDSTVAVNVVLRSSLPAESLASAVRGVIAGVDPQQPATQLRPLAVQIASVTLRERFSAVLVASLAFVGSLFAICGLYGVIAYSVGQRRGELGLRLALGATPASILKLVLRQGGLVIAIGLCVGLATARVVAGWLGPLLYRVDATEPATFAAVAVVLSIVGLIACYVPARRAGNIDPVESLRP
jgi:predicted permease